MVGAVASEGNRRGGSPTRAALVRSRGSPDATTTTQQAHSQSPYPETARPRRGSPRGARCAGRAPAAERTRDGSERAPGRQVARDSPFVRGELIRIGIVSAVCMGLLLALVAIDRLG